MKILLLGDPHFKKNNLDIMKNVCDEILAIIDETKPDMVIALGDTLDTHERIYLRALVQATKFFLEISKRCPLINIIGNHDRENNSDFQSDIHPFIGLKDHNNITIIDKAVWQEDKNFIYVPYVPDGKFLQALETVKYDISGNKQPLLIFCHQLFTGANMGNVVSNKGDNWNTSLPSIFSGHIHKYQQIPGVIYVGTMFQQNYGEDTDKAVMFLHIDEDDNGNILTKGDDIKRPKMIVQRVPLTSAPTRITIKLDMNDLYTFHQKIPSNVDGKNLIRVIFSVDATEVKSLKITPQYKALEHMVDKLEIKTIGNKASVAEQIVSNLKQTGSIQHKMIYSLEEIVTAMLKDDSNTLEIFTNEILKGTNE